MATYKQYIEDIADLNIVEERLAIEEWNLYGSSRLGAYSKEEIVASRVGVWNGTAFVPGDPPTYTINGVPATGTVFDEQVGYKNYELSNHLGNVLATVTDRKVPSINGTSYDYFNAQITSIGDYYPFGMQIEERSWTAPSSKYRFGFQGQESDDEISGNGNSLDFGARIYDCRLGRWLSVDPLADKFPDESPYIFASDNPIVLIDANGEAPGYPMSHPVARAIKSFNIWILYAFEGSNNTSTIQFHNLARGNAGRDARSKAIGAIGEGLFASRLTSKPASDSRLFIGHSIGGFHHDLYQMTTLIKTPGVGKFELKVNFTDVHGNKRSQKVTVLGNKKFAVGKISYEVKTNSPTTSKANILSSFKSGVQQVLNRSKVVDAAVLVFDKDAFDKIKDDPQVKLLLKKLENTKNKHGQRKTFLNLEKDLSKDSNKAFHALQDKIKKIEK